MYILKGITVFIIISCSVLLYCSKGKGDEGSVLVSVKHNGGAVPQAVVYIKYGTTAIPGLPLSLYDMMSSTDAAGQVYFDKLQPQGYFIYPAKGQSINGSTGITINSRFRQNHYDITVDLH